MHKNAIAIKPPTKTFYFPFGENIFSSRGKFKIKKQQFKKAYLCKSKAGLKNKYTNKAYLTAIVNLAQTLFLNF